MADAAVRVDIIVGQNSVVPAVERTSATLQGAQRAASGLNGTFSNLSNGGVRRLEAGFQALAFQAAGVPGPLGKIASGAVLLGGGSGVLLGVAAAAGGLALAWKTLTTASTEAEAAMERLKPKLTEMQRILADIKTVQDDIARNDWWRQLAIQAAMAFPAISTLAGAVMEVQAALLASAEEGKRAAIEATNKAIVDRINLLNKQGEIEGRKILEADAAARERQSNRDYRMAVGLTGGPQLAVSSDTAIAIRDNLIAPLAEATLAWQAYNAEVANGIAKQVSMFETVWLMADAFATLTEGIGAAIVGYENLGAVMLKAVTQAITAFARKHAQKEYAMAAESFAEGIWPPNPLAIAAGFKHLAAAAGWSVLAGAAGGAGASASVGRAASGGVDSDRYRRDQDAAAARGTVTVSMKGGFIDPRSPEFQEFIAQVIKEAKGRNVVFA